MTFDETIKKIHLLRVSAVELAMHFHERYHDKRVEWRVCKDPLCARAKYLFGEM